jgi:hypothetical protein
MNLFLFGSLIFIGISCVTVVSFAFFASGELNNLQFGGIGRGMENGS